MFRRLAAYAPVGLFLSSSDGAVTYVNARWCEMAGMTPETALGSGWQAAVHPEDRERVTAAWADAVRTDGEFHEEFRFQKPDGRVTWVNASGSAMEDPQTGRPGFIGSCADVTERKQWEARMRLYEGMFAMTPDFAYVFGTDHRLLYANRSLLKMWGHTWEFAMGKTWLELGYETWHAEMHIREMETVIRTKQPWKAEIPFTGTHGRRIYEYIFTPVIGENGEVEAVAGTTRDVTERKQAEERENFLSRLAGKLAPLHAEREIIRAAVEAVGSHLGCQRAYFVECLMSENLIRVGENWVRDGEVSLEGDHALEDFGGAEWWALYSGGNLAVENVDTHQVTQATRSTYERVGVRSYAVQPFKREGDWTVVLGVTDDRPRRWTAEEMELLENVVARVWPLVEQARAVEAMRKSQERLALVSDSIPALVGLIGTDHRFRYGNERCREWFDFPRGGIEGAHLREVMGGETYRTRLPFFARALKGETVRFEEAAHHKTLGRRELELTYTPDRAEDGTVRGFFVMGTDITERKEEETAMKRQNEGRRLLGEAGRVILNSDTPEVMLRRMCGTVSEFLQADVCVVVTPTDDGDGLRVEFSHGLGEELVEAIGRIYFGPEAVEGTSLSHRLAKGFRQARAVLEVEGVRGYSCRPLLVGQEVLGVLIFASRRRGPFFPQEMEFLDTLSQYVTGAHVRLRLVESLRESDRRKDQFLATLAHELRNPLAPILTGLDVMKRSGRAPEVVARVTGIIERQAAQMVHLIDDLLDMSRVNTGKIVLKKSAEPYTKILRNAIEAAQPLVGERGHSLEVRLPEEEAVVDVDPSRVAQVVSNLLSNAAKYTPPGGEIRLEAGVEGADAWVKVRDNGLGIEPAEQQSIFELFQQTANGSADGLGIGLTLVKSLVELHGGSVGVRSEGSGKGSEFQVRLPGCVVAGEPEPAAPEPAAPAVPQRKRVLVVDDGKNAADMLALFFRLEGMEVAVAYDGREGLETARAFDPDLVMMDLGMPVMDGMEAARQMRAENIGGTLVALSGWGRDEDKQRTAEAGFHHHVVKPVCPDDLRAIMERYFGNGRDEGALPSVAEGKAAD